VNILAHKAMLSAYGKGRREVTLADMKAAVLDTQASVRRTALGRPNFLSYGWS
jgi:MSHA biogenesis protein MshM